MTLPISQVITQRIKQDGRRYHANDNVSAFIKEGEHDLLVDELADKFEQVLQSLIIDTSTDPNSKGTAKRLAKMYIHELFRGRYYPSPEVTAFPNDGSCGTKPYTGMLVVPVEINSMCSHHHQAVTGKAYIGIVPTSNIIGLSKYARITQHIARRGTLQEELCGDVAKAIMDVTASENVAVHIAAEHGCMTCRGVMAKHSLTQTTVLHGVFHKDSVRQEFFDNIRMQRMKCE